MTTTILGKVRPTFRGTYDNTVQYVYYDVVDFEGSSYIAKEDVIGVLPTDATKWQLNAEKGNIGATGPIGPTGPSGINGSGSSNTSQSGLFPNFLNRLMNGDLTGTLVAWVGNSHTWGQGSTDTGGEIVPQLPAPTGVTDLFHQRSPYTGTFVDKISRLMKKIYGLTITKRVVGASDNTYNAATGTWTTTTDSRMNTSSGNADIRESSTIGDSLIKNLDGTTQQRCATFHFARVNNGGKLDVLIKTNNTGGVATLNRSDKSVWKKPSEIDGIIRSDGATGVSMDSVDLYNATDDYAYSLGFTFPYFANWQVKFTVSSSKNSSSSGNLCKIGTTVLDHANFINAGRGNHTTLDYLGNVVSLGAGGSGDFDHTDHLAEVLAKNPSLIILEPMVINDWLHGESLQDTTTCFQEMVRRIKKANCDLLIITPSPIITTDVVLDYTANPNYSTMPPLVNNLNSLGKYEEYIDVVLKVAYWEQVPVINNYDYFLERFTEVGHQNWTLGTDAGRIHVNQYGHNIYYDGIVKKSGLFPDTVIDVTDNIASPNNAPNAPVISLVSKTSNSITIKLDTASTDVEDGVITSYEIYKGGVLHSTITLAQNVTYQITGLTQNTAYSITAKAKDSKGLLSSASNTIFVTTDASTNNVPTAPVISLVTASVTATSATINLDTASTDIEDGTITSYEVYWDGVYKTTLTISQGGIYNCTGLTELTTTIITFKGKDSTGALSNVSNSVSVTTKSAFSDDFNGLAGNSPDSTKWTVATTGVETGYAQLDGNGSVRLVTAGATDAVYLVSKNNPVRNEVKTRKIKITPLTINNQYTLVEIDSVPVSPYPGVTGQAAGIVLYLQNNAGTWLLRAFRNNAAGVFGGYDSVSNQWTTTTTVTHTTIAAQTSYVIHVVSTATGVTIKVYDGTETTLLKQYPEIPWSDIFSNGNTLWFYTGDTSNTSHIVDVKIDSYTEI